MTKNINTNHWTGYVRWTSGKHTGYEEEIVVLAKSKLEAENLVALELDENYPDADLAEIVAVEPGRGTLESDS